MAFDSIVFEHEYKFELFLNLRDCEWFEVKIVKTTFWSFQISENLY